MTDKTNLKKLWENPENYSELIQKPDFRLRPFEFLDLEDEQEISKWKREFFMLSDREMEERAQVWVDNLRMYSGKHFQAERKRQTSESKEKRRTSKPFPIGIVNELVEQKVSKVTSNRVGIKAVPPKNTQTSTNSARLANKHIQYLEYTEKAERLYEKWQRATHIFGEAYVWTDWYPERGPLEPAFEKLEEQLKKEGKDPNREIVYTTNEGTKIYASAVKRQGEVGFKLKYPWQIRFELNVEWENSCYVFIEEREYVERVLAKYGDLTLTDEEGQEVDIEDLVGEDGKVPVFYFYHKETDFLHKGRKIVFVGDSVVENTVHPHKAHKLPIVRNIDIEIPSEYRPMSFIENVKHLNRAYDGVTFLMLKAMAQGAHLKWITPRKACNHYALADLATIVEYSGGVPPRLEMPRVLSPEMFQLRDALKEEIKELAAVHGVSFGDVPKRIDSSLAMQHLEEQETKREKTAITRHREGIQEIWQHAIDIIGVHYDLNSKRIIRTVGPHDELSIESIKGADLAGPYEIRIVGTSALPETIAGKTDRLIALRKEFPELVPDPYVVDTLELAQDDRYITYATVAIRKAEAVNEKLMANLPVPDPQPYEDLITHWQILMKLVQSQKFEEAEKETKKRALERVGTLEMLMWEKTTKITGRGFSQKLQALDGWPAVFELPDPGQVPGQATGVPIDLQEGNAAEQAPPQGAPQAAPAQAGPQQNGGPPQGPPQQQG